VHGHSAKYGPKSNGQGKSKGKGKSKKKDGKKYVRFADIEDKDTWNEIQRLSLSFGELQAYTAATEDSLADAEALLDCGATASAGGEDAVTRLIAAVAQANPEAQIPVLKDARPWFRFGDGRWGKALYAVEVHGPYWKFRVYALQSLGVPVLFGMADLETLCVVINFASGASVIGGNFKIQRKTAKKHYCINLATDLPTRNQPADLTKFLPALVCSASELKGDSPRVRPRGSAQCRAALPRPDPHEPARVRR
jgi:hypothetical protein